MQKKSYLSDWYIQKPIEIKELERKEEVLFPDDNQIDIKIKKYRKKKMDK